jgi:hypothetical protein
LIHLPAEGRTFAPFLLCGLSAAAEELIFLFAQSRKEGVG